MPKPIKSKQLYIYLLERGVLGLGENAIKEAKKEYLKKYKREWKRTHIQRKKEYRPIFTATESKILIALAQKYNLTPTAFIKGSALEKTGIESLIPNKDMLYTILQKISMANTHLLNERKYIHAHPELSELIQLLVNAETMLLQYLNHYDSQNSK